MPLLSRLAAAETWPEMEKAAEERFWDAYTLAVGGTKRETGAVYLFGYVVEMVLKTAFFRVRGVLRNEDTGPARQLARQLAQGDLSYWGFVLARARAATGRALDPTLLGVLQLKVSAVAANWSETLRYRDINPSETELHEVVNSVEWILEHRSEFWS